MTRVALQPAVSAPSDATKTAGTRSLSFLLVLGFSANLDPSREHEAIAAELAPLIRDQRVSMLPPLLRSTHRELVSRLTTYRPDIVHFVGHGESGEVLLTDDEGNPRELNTDMARDLFRALAQTGASPGLVFLNCCFASEVGKAIAREGPTAVAFEARVGDAWACRYAASFYEHWLGKGMDLNQANQFAMVAAGNLPLGTMKPNVFPGTRPYRGVRLEDKPNAEKEAKRRSWFAWQAITAVFFACAVILGFTTDVMTLRGCSGAGATAKENDQGATKSSATQGALGNTDGVLSNGKDGPEKTDHPETKQKDPATPTLKPPPTVPTSNPDSVTTARESKCTLLVLPPVNGSGRNDRIKLSIGPDSIEGESHTVFASQLGREVQFAVGEAISGLVDPINSPPQPKKLVYIDREGYERTIREAKIADSDKAAYFENVDGKKACELFYADAFLSSEIGKLNFSRYDDKSMNIHTKLVTGSVRIMVRDAKTGAIALQMSVEAKGVGSESISDDKLVEEWTKCLKKELVSKSNASKIAKALKDMCQ